MPVVTINQKTKVPTRKIKGGGVGGGISIVLIWLLGLVGVEVPADVAVAFGGLAVWLSAYFTKESVST